MDDQHRNDLPVHRANQEVLVVAGRPKALRGDQEVEQCKLPQEWPIDEAVQCLEAPKHIEDHGVRRHVGWRRRVLGEMPPDVGRRPEPHAAMSSHLMAEFLCTKGNLAELQALEEGAGNAPHLKVQVQQQEAMQSERFILGAAAVQGARR